ncbi:MAG TPA: Clp protease N-terminal domain-containing protein [Acidimicrobiales bacterium]|jgi:ATP-dependent Clp protease ATP-binding subunit ClpA|nr:Clp protease N-terminal domain-containing protein [Acidimicrobiales bacterium]
MGKVNVYLPDDLEAAARATGISISAVCQAALRGVVDSVTAISDPSGGGWRRISSNPAAAGLGVTPRLASILDDVERRAIADGREVSVFDLLGGIVDHGENLGARVLRDLGVELPPSGQVPRRKSPRPSTARSGGDRVLDDDAVAVLRGAARAASEMRHPRIGTEHLVLAMGGPSAPEAIASMFAALSLDERSLRRHVQRLGENPWAVAAPEHGDGSPADHDERLARLEREVERLAEQLRAGERRTR